jgi:hypothetical protein
MVKFIRIFNSEAINPNTGEIVKSLRVDSDNGKVYKLLNTIDELKAHGNMSKVLNDLRLQDGQFGDYVRLPRFTDLGNVTWEDTVVEPVKTK